MKPHGMLKYQKKPPLGWVCLSFLRAFLFNQIRDSTTVCYCGVEGHYHVNTALCAAIHRLAQWHAMVQIMRVVSSSSHLRHKQCPSCLSSGSSTMTTISEKSRYATVATVAQWTADHIQRVVSVQSNAQWTRSHTHTVFCYCPASGKMNTMGSLAFYTSGYLRKHRGQISHSRHVGEKPSKHDRVTPRSSIILQTPTVTRLVKNSHQLMKRAVGHSFTKARI
jgi:hypothetical protein